MLLSGTPIVHALNLEQKVFFFLKKKAKSNETKFQANSFYIIDKNAKEPNLL